MCKATLPVAPWLFIHDPTPNAVFASKLVDLIPRSWHVKVPSFDSIGWMKNELSTYKAIHYQDKVIIFSSDQPNGACESRPFALTIRGNAIENACNFASVNLYHEDGKEKKTEWGVNHLDIKITGHTVDRNTPEVAQVAKQVHEWLFTVLDTRVTLHLIPDDEMKYGDVKTRHEMSVTGYEYCTISEIRKKPKDLRIHIVGVILTKPTVSASKRLTFQVADKTGVLNVCLVWRSAYNCDYAWNWCLSMQPGQRRALPLMPCVKVKENVFVTVVKLPFRITGSVVVGTGHVVKTAGRGLCAVGRGLRMGHRTKWVFEDDFREQYGNAAPAKGDGNSKPSTPKECPKEKDDNLWGDSDSDSSTTAGSDFNEKKEKFLL